ncbi:hypothetical protein [Polynucleobacter alcilacus]|jgi:hypothetical protein|uniref:hypothetical protein n=1 Tax=Polynucleobacter alcilacus TaxID=1819739 RepID=UPI001C0B2232|nr:hypothetical protein [Polynucleobacter alcilacus]MBU3567831.1 hypothetical protein [Polynucleobacter alcilacus]
MRFKLVIAALALLPALVSAQNAPNMIGTWTGTFNATVMGSAAHHIVPNKKDKEIYFNKIPFALEIDRQEGINFSGLLTSKNRKEVILGAITPDFQGGVMVDEDGTHTFKIIDPTTIQNCYVQISKPKVAACWIGKKQ